MVYSETNFPVRYYETDQMGIVHHSNYIRYFECARNNMMREFGYPIEQCEEDGVTIPIVSVECHYKFPARMGDDLRVVAMIDTMPLAKLRIKQAVYNQGGTLWMVRWSWGFLIRRPDVRPVVQRSYLKQ